VTLPKTQYPDTERQNAFVQETLRRVEALPGVKSAAATINLPLVGTWGMGYSVVGHDNAPLQIADNANVTPGYFRAMGIPVLRGRDFSDRDTADGPKVVVISEALARKHFPDENPLGQRINAGGEREVVGVVADVRTASLDAPAPPTVYYSHLQGAANRLSLVVRAAGGSALGSTVGLASAIRREVRALDPTLPIYAVSTMEEQIARSSAVFLRRSPLVLIAAFAAAALALAVVGIYGVISYSVTQRTRELGIRIALGATPAAVRRMVVRQGLAIAAAGLALGLAGAAALTRLMRSLLYGVTPTDPVTFAGVAAVLVGIAVLASYLPARRATRVDPILALRAE
jgi:predicted permease